MKTMFIYAIVIVNIITISAFGLMCWLVGKYEMVKLQPYRDFRINEVYEAGSQVQGEAKENGIEMNSQTIENATICGMTVNNNLSFINELYERALK